MSQQLRLRIFVSSPGDVSEERALAGRVFRRLAKEFADVATLDLILWEHEPLFAHAGFQEQIPLPSQCDLVVSILWSRLGTRLPRNYSPEPGQAPPTGTEFEVRDALAAFEKFGRPNLLIYRKRAPPHVDMASTDAEERFRQYRQLQEFCRTAFYDAEGAVLVAHHSFSDGADFERRLTEHARKWIGREIEKAGEHHARPRWTHGSPFRGLQPFDAEHQDVFFGRSQAVGELIRRLRDAESAPAGAARLLLIAGMSGSGKTSVVRAGLLPLLAERPVEGIAGWTTVSVRPSDVESEAEGPFGALASRLCRALPAAGRLGITAAELAAGLERDPGACAARIETLFAAEASASKLPPRQVRLVLYVDQLEEVFTVPAVAGRASAFLDVMAALAALPTVWVIATVRSDFVHRLETHAAIMDVLRRSSPYTLLAPRGDELADMIREPALAAGLDFEERDGVALDREILRDATANPESLPLVQYALQQLYEHREGRTLRWDVYKPADHEGGLRGSLVAVAEAAFAAAGPEADAAFRAVMRELTSVGEDGSAVRRYARLEAMPHGTPARGFVDRLVAERLCVTDRHGTEPVVSLAHEALLQSWPRVQDWLQRESALLRLRDELLRDAKEWHRHGRSDGWLGTAPEKLSAMAQLERERLVPAGAVADYALRSRRRARRQRLLRRCAIGSICVLALAATGAGVIATRQRDRARAEAMTADRTLRFLVSLFDFADPGENRGNSVTVREVLDRGARDVGHGLEREPAVRADLLTAMGEAYTGLGLYAPAKDLLDQARRDQGSTTVAPESAVRTLIASGTTLFLAADYAGAESHLRRAVEAASTRLPAASPLLSEARDALADVLTQNEKYAEAETLCRLALAVDRTRGRDGAVLLARTLNALATAYYAEGKLADAEPPMREALALRKEHLGLRHARTAESLNNLGSLLYQEGRYSDAAAEWREALPVFREVYGAEHPEVATILNNLGRSTLMAGRVQESIPLLGDALRMDEALKDATHDDLVLPLNSLGMAYLYLGDVGRARESIDRALRIARLRNHWLLDQVVLNAADVQLSLGRPDAAAPLLAEARRLLETRYPLAKDAAERWRYAAWEAVDARRLAEQRQGDAARSAYGHARGVLVERFGAQGYYVLRLDQRFRAG